jgi:hypothetical protein
MMAAPVLPNPIASLMLEDLRRAAVFLDELADAPNAPSYASIAHAHAVRLWAASQAVERLAAAVEQIVIHERSRRAWNEAES